ncbi:hypothetical protein Tco_1125705 [Tanacetum coccineum]|uniref:Uncharacterized protein n=1 Tax=Tanacetum coccineum TaxID=301880 RepID=A0ABQ5JBF7_9ASTR
MSKARPLTAANARVRCHANMGLWQKAQLSVASPMHMPTFIPWLPCDEIRAELRGIVVKDIIKEVKDYLKTYSSAGMDMRWGGSHVTNVSAFDVDDFTSWKDSQKDYKGEYKALKAELALLNKKIDDVLKNKSEKRLVGESFDWDEESLSFKDEGVTRVKAFMAIAEDEPTVRKADTRSGQWVEITMKKVQRLLSMTDGDERKHVLYYTYVDLHYMKIRGKTCSASSTLLNKSCPHDEVSGLKKVIGKWTSSKVTLDQLRTEQVHGIVCALGEIVKRKETISSKEIMFTKEENSPTDTILEVTSDTKSECDSQEPLSPLPKLLGAEPIDKTKQVTEKELSVKAIKKKAHTKSPLASSSRKAPKISIPFILFKYCGFNEHHSDKYEYYPGCDVSGSIAHEPADYDKKTTPNNRKPRIANQ